MKRAPFSCYRTRSVPETVARLAGRGDGAKILAGGIGPLPPPTARVQELATNGGGR